MKRARKKRIVRRKRRISEREIMRIKRKLKKSARKLRLGAKRTGAYVYGTLRRIVGNPGGRYRVGGGYKTFTLDEAKREAERIFRTTGNIVSIEEHRPTPQVAPTWKYGIYTGRGVVKKNPLEKMGVYAGRDGFEITDFKRGDRIQLHPGMDLWMRGAKYGQIIGIGRKKLLVKLDYLRRPIAISPRNIGEIMYREIGENRRRTAGRRRIVRVLGYDVVEGSKKHMRLLAQKRHFDDLQRSERGLRGNPSVTMQDIQRIVGKINSEGGGARVVPAGSGGLNLYLDRISPYDDKIIDVGHEYLLRGTKRDIYEALIKIRFVPMYHPYARKLNR